jgi:hypothetical protein
MTISNRKVTCLKWWKGNYSKGESGLFPVFAWRTWGKPWKASDGIGGNPADSNKVHHNKLLSTCRKNLALEAGEWSALFVPEGACQRDRTINLINDVIIWMVLIYFNPNVGQNNGREPCNTGRLLSVLASIQHSQPFSQYIMYFAIR